MPILPKITPGGDTTPMDLARHCIVRPGSNVHLKKLDPDEVQALDNMQLKYPPPAVDLSKVVLR